MNEFRFGTLPDGWQKMPMRRCLLMRQNGSWGDEPIDDGDGEYCLRAADFDYPRLAFKGEENFVRRSYGPGAFENVHLKDGDILIEKSGGGEKTPVGRAILFDGSFTAGFSNFMERQRVNTQICVPEYYFYWWTAMYQQDVFTQYIKQTTGLQNLDTGTLLSQEYMPLPPLSEQERIARAVKVSLLDMQKTTDQLCAQISTLERYKSSLIHEAVTKGLDRDVPLKSSGVEWIGDIPAKWTLQRVKCITDILAGYAFSSDDFSQEDGVKLLRGINVDVGVTRWDDVFYYPYKISGEIERYRLKEGDLLLGLDRPWISTGLRMAIVSSSDLPALLVQRVARIRPSGGNDIRFVRYCFDSGILFNELSGSMTGISVPHISTSQVGHCVVPLPPVLEQREIADYLDDRCSRIDRILDLKRRQVDVLRRRRQSLIYEYVTGKRRVGKEA
jgi:type I restriction enzyme S subunit